MHLSLGLREMTDLKEEIGYRHWSMVHEIKKKIHIQEIANP